MGSWCYGLVEVHGETPDDTGVVLCEIFFMDNKQYAIAYANNKDMLRDKVIIADDIAAQMKRGIRFVWKNNKLKVIKPRKK